MPKKKTVLSDGERRKRLREAAREHETSEDPKDFEEVFKVIALSKPPKA
jgi:hypothetical protein